MLHADQQYMLHADQHVRATSNQRIPAVPRERECEMRMDIPRESAQSER